jgi:Fe-S cluster assembly protein SufD
MAEIRAIKTASETALIDSFAVVHERLPGNADVAARRREAFGRFEAEGLPTRRVEEWKYTDLRSLMREAKPLAAPPDAAAIKRSRKAGSAAGIEARRLVFVDGSFVGELSDLAEPEPGLSISTLAQALAAPDPGVVGKLKGGDDIALSLNTAFMADGAVIRVAPGVTLVRPLQLVFVHGSTKPTACFVRSLIEIGDGANATIVETHEGPAKLDYQVNVALDLLIGARAEIEHVKIGQEGGGAFHVGSLNVEVGERAVYRHFILTTGGAVVRNQLWLRVAGKDAQVALGGASLLRLRQHADVTAVIEHATTGGRSRETFKSVLDQESRGIFQGKIVVQPGAQKTDARMASHALLLSPSAEADNKPELEIFADDVQCGHGATAGALDENLKFYLMARGISQSEAEALLIQAFVGEAVEMIRHDGLNTAIMNIVGAWLESRS